MWGWRGWDCPEKGNCLQPGRTVINCHLVYSHFNHAPLLHVCPYLPCVDVTMIELSNVILILRCYTELMEDPLRDVVPKFHGHKSHADKGAELCLCNALRISNTIFLQTTLNLNAFYLTSTSLA